MLIRTLSTGAHALAATSALSLKASLLVELLFIVSTAAMINRLRSAKNLKPPRWQLISEAWVATNTSLVIVSCIVAAAKRQ